MDQRFPTSSEISAALAALGVYAEVPSERDLAEQALAVGGESVLAAMLANALFGAAIGLAMLAEGRMLEPGIKAGERLSLARTQAFRASGAEGPGFVGVLHWQAAQLAWPLRPLRAAEQSRWGGRWPRARGRWCRCCSRRPWLNRPAAGLTR